MKILYLRIFNLLDSQDGNQRASVIRATTDSPMSPPPLTSIAQPISRNNPIRLGGIYSGPKSLLDIFLSNEKSNKRPDFHGRSEGTVVKLYANLVKSENDRGSSRGEGGMEVEG